MHFAGDTRMPESVVSGANRDEVHRDLRSFANPVQNVAKLALREGMKVADFGAGSGAYTKALAHAVGTTGHVYAVEIQKELAETLENTLVRAHIENASALWGDFENVGGSKLADDTLDTVLISNTLFQLEDKIGAMKEAYRVLKEGGQLAIIDWSDSYAGMGPPKKLVVTQQAATLLATDAGFAPTFTFDAGTHHYGAVYRKQKVATHKNDVVPSAIAQEIV